MTDRPCKVCNFTRQKSYGLVVPTLDELKLKGREFLGFSPSEPVTVVLEDDGTIVEDQSYFLCLPLNTKFMLLHEKEYVVSVDGGTAWMARDSMLLEADSVDAACAAAPWWDLSQQLKHDLASIILMSEADLQALVDAPCAELATAMGFQEKKAAELQETLQTVLDRTRGGEAVQGAPPAVSQSFGERGQTAGRAKSAQPGRMPGTWTFQMGWRWSPHPVSCPGH
ncbi:DNA fragmentation factor subunit alpha [Larimichthys crocea]|uniref:Uncharacterized protein n=1 Tax=Larimichthys crocea TaxID=215358 RepID=A0ACD3RA96_LARCR|nr:DNA fragmentation factor subunit alpha [Larimichthys crocea]